MLPANTYVIRPATDDDQPALEALAELDSQRPLHRPALIGEIDGRPAAAISLRRRARDRRPVPVHRAAPPGAAHPRGRAARALGRRPRCPSACARRSGPFPWRGQPRPNR